MAQGFMASPFKAPLPTIPQAACVRNAQGVGFDSHVLRAASLGLLKHWTWGMSRRGSHMFLVWRDQPRQFCDQTGFMVG